MSKFIYLILFSVFLWSTGVTQGYADLLEDCKSECSSTGDCGAGQVNPGQCVQCMQLCNDIASSKTLEQCNNICGNCGTGHANPGQCVMCRKLCNRLHTAQMAPVTPQTAPMGTVTPRTAPMGTIDPQNPSMASSIPASIPALSCASICDFGRKGNIEQGKHDRRYLSADNDLLNECYGILTDPNCFDLCKNKICSQQNIKSGRITSTGAEHCRK